MRVTMTVCIIYMCQSMCDHVQDVLIERLSSCLCGCNVLMKLASWRWEDTNGSSILSVEIIVILYVLLLVFLPLSALQKEVTKTPCLPHCTVRNGFRSSGTDAPQWQVIITGYCYRRDQIVSKMKAINHPILILTCIQELQITFYTEREYSR